MSKYQKWTVLFCLLMSASLIFGQTAKTVFTFAPLTGWILGAIFCILAIITAIKAYSAS
ncbi:hypothetical protein [Syntrophomonas wolfei]|uniref:hypothetical protein n=1 Tax=Syntrophomonas wolfei TaxID=863 RepID=UPI000B2D5B2D|nr:hypothetical protein [Syntrophomonas wolfei]